MSAPTLVEFVTARLDEDEAEQRVIVGGSRRAGKTHARRHLATVAAHRAIVEAESYVYFDEWTPDCGGDWCLNVGAGSDEPGVGAFANYWPDNTVSASVYRDDVEVARSGIVSRATKAECMAFAEQFIRGHFPLASPALRNLATIWADHPDYRQEWKP